ncbi:hypothetical protein [Rhodococcus sp. ACPA4]|uniref:hypothetical protein n=1 Tax=Rhodococcus sp. ACPA4 TaxID=2028571 RepID=UPI0015CBA762|nr:hypothetical protein [Rhodococcus sp. ACPA4]
MWLVDDAGNSARAALPVDGTCGNPLPDTYAPDTYVAITNLTMPDEQAHDLPRTL